MFEGLLIGLVALGTLSMVGYQLYTGVPAMPSRRAERLQALDLLASVELPEQGVIYELGCGWGGLVDQLAGAYPDHSIIGYELSWLPFWYSKWRFRSRANVVIQRKNFLKSDLSDAVAVVCYLMMGPMPRLAKQFDQQLMSGTPVVTLAFWFRGRVPDEQVCRGGPGVALYRWRIGS